MSDHIDILELARVRAAMEDPNAVFVFGSNEAGRHGKGAARDALLHYGAEYGKGIGHYGRSYALPTKDFHLQVLSLEEITAHVRHFRMYAERHPHFRFIVTRVGCGLAGYTDAQMAPLFQAMPHNVELPIAWRPAAPEAP